MQKWAIFIDKYLGSKFQSNIWQLEFTGQISVQIRYLKCETVLSYANDLNEWMKNRLNFINAIIVRKPNDGSGKKKVAMR